LIEVKFTNTIELFTGRIGLTKKQAARRPGCLEMVKKGEFEIVKPVQFKAGEAIRLPEIPKPFIHLLDEKSAEKIQAMAESEMRERIEAEAKAQAEVEAGKAGSK
jgi:hypothetical protein